MMFVKARPNEYLVVARRGRIVDHGIGGRALCWPGSSHALIPSTKQEAAFAMTQETQEGIPLRFKGIVIYRVTRPELTARLFDFCGGDGHEQIKSLLGHICLGELRAAVSRMTMDECIQQRKTTLTQAVACSLGPVVGGDGGGAVDGWGIELDVVQVGQVFIIDDELRRQLECEVRDKIKATSELSRIRAQEEIKLAQIKAARVLEEEDLQTHRRKQEIDHERRRLGVELERAQAEVETPARLFMLQQEALVLEQELLVRRLESQVREQRALGETQRQRVEQELRRQILPLEQLPEIAEAVSGMFQGANLSIYGDGSELVAAVAPLAKLVSERLHRTCADPGTST